MRPPPARSRSTPTAHVGRAADAPSHLRAQLPRQLERGSEGLEHTRLDPLPGQLLGHAEADTVEALAARQLDLVRETQARSRRRHHARPCGAASAPRRERRASTAPPDRARRRTRSCRSAIRSRTSVSARRSRTGPRAGGSSRPCRCRAPTGRARPRQPLRSRRRSRPARARGPTGCAPRRTPSSRWRSPSRTRPGWSSPAGSRRRASAARRRWPCTAAHSPRGCASPTGWARPRCRTGP